MKITFGMPEVLVLYSLIMYPQSFTISLVTLTLGVFSRLICYSLEKDQEELNTKEIL